MNLFRILITALKLAATLGLLWFALRGIDLTAVLARTESISWPWLFFAFAACLFQFVFIAERWRELSRFCDIDLTRLETFQLVMIGNFFSQVLPSSLGGDAVRLWLLGRQSGWRETTYSILIDRGFGLLAISTIIVVVGPIGLGYLKDDAMGITLIAIGGGTLLAGAVFAASGFAPLPALDRIPLLRQLHDCAKIVAAVLRSPLSGSLVISTSVITHVIAIVMTYGLARAISAPVSLVELFVLLPPVMLIAALPVSIAGWGIRELSMVTAFAYAGLEQTDGLVISLLTGLLQLAVGVAGGVMWIVLRMSPKRRSKAATASPDRSELTADGEI